MQHGANELRALVAAPIGRDAALVVDALRRAGIEGRICASADELAREAAAGAGLCIVAEEALATDVSALRETLQRQPPWSDLPILLVIHPETSLEEVLPALGPLGNATPLPRPFRVQTLVNTARTLLRARKRQYEARDMMEQLASSDRRKTEFLALLGHELRNPLAAISVSVHQLERSATGGEHVRRAVSVIDRQTRNLSRMIEDLLDVSRITSGKIVLRPQPVELRDVCEHVYQVLEPAARASRIALTISLPEGRIVVRGDSVRLEQVVTNLVGNALRYTPEGGRVSLSVTRAPPSAIVTVSDTGIGIDREMLSKIFDPFVQAHAPDGRSRGGLGLGLALVRDLVQMHGGTVFAESAGEGRGSTFTVTLPLSREEALPRRNESEVPRSRGSDGVVVIEDNADIRELMAQMLESWGYRVETAGEGAAGVDLVRSLAPRFALVDIGLPDIDGYEVARKLRANVPREKLLLVAMSGFGQPEDRARAFEAGFDLHLVKPVEPEDLRKLLADVAIDRK